MSGDYEIASLSVYVHQQILENSLTKESCDFYTPVWYLVLGTIFPSPLK